MGAKELGAKTQDAFRPHRCDQRHGCEDLDRWLQVAGHSLVADLRAVPQAAQSARGA